MHQKQHVDRRGERDRSTRVAADVLATYAVIGVRSTEQVTMFMPLAMQEMVLAVWMIARGFRLVAVPTTPELADAVQAAAEHENH